MLNGENRLPFKEFDLPFPSFSSQIHSHTQCLHRRTAFLKSLLFKCVLLGIGMYLFIHTVLILLLRFVVSLFGGLKKNVFLTLALTFVTCVGAVALITAVFEPKEEELESKPSTACESSGPLFSSTHL